MKFTPVFFAGLAAAARLSQADAEAYCGDLGVMPVPEGANPDNVRTCLEHPLGSPKTPQILEKRDCWYGKKSGCSKGYCWKTCGQGGQWCWTAQGDGSGPWVTCGSDGDCNESQSCGGGGCKACGCSC